VQRAIRLLSDLTIIIIKRLLYLVSAIIYRGTLMKVLNKLAILLESVFTHLRFTYQAKCGHKTKLKGVIRYGGANRVKSVPLAKDGQPYHCLECLEEKLIHCTWCGGPIVFGDMMVLCLTAKDSKVAQSAVRLVEKRRDRYASCLRKGCSPRGAKPFRYGIPEEDNAIKLGCVLE